MAEGFSAVTKQMFEDRKAQQAEFERQQEVLENMKTQLEESGMKAEDNKEYNKQNAALQKKMLASRLKGADSPSARKEIKQEQKAEAKKNQNLLGKIAGGVTGMFGSLKDAAAKKISGAGKGLMNILKGTLLAGAMLAIVAFLNSEYWENLKNFLADKVIPALKAIWEWMKLLFSNPVQALKDLMKGILEGAADVGAFLWNKALKPFWDWVVDIFKGMDWSKLWSDMLSGAATIGAWIWDKALKPFWKWIVGVFTDIDWGALWKGLWGAATSIGAWIWDKAIKPFFSWIGGIFVSGFDALWTATFGAVASVGAWIWDNSIKPFWDWIVEKFTFAKDAVVAGWTNLKTWIVEKATAVKEWIVEKFTFTKDAVIAGWVGLKEKVAEIALAVKDWFVEKFTFAKDAVVAGWTGLKTFVSEAAIAIKQWFTDKFTFASDAVVAGWTNLKTWIVEKATAVKDWIKGLFAWAATDEKVEGEEEGWSIRSVVTNAIKTVVKWISSLFTFDEGAAGIAAGIINIIYFLPNMIAKGILAAGKWLLKLFGFDEAAEKVANPEDFSIGGLIVGAVEKIVEWFTDLLDVDWKALMTDMVPDWVKNSVVGGWLGFGGDGTPTQTSKPVGQAEKSAAARAAMTTEELRNFTAGALPQQHGGVFSGLKPLLVGEAGPELILPNRGGRVMNAQRTDAMRDSMIQRRLDGMGGMGGQSIIAPTTVANTNSTNITHTTTSLVNPDLVVSTINKAA